MYQALLLISELTFHEAKRRRTFWLAGGLGFLFIALYALGFFFVYKEMRQSLPKGFDLALTSGFSFFLTAGFYGISFLGVMLAVLASATVFAGDIQSQTIQLLATKPLPRHCIVLGKWLGLGVLLSIYISALSLGLVLATYLIARYIPPNVFAGILLLIMEALVMLTIGILAGTHLNMIGSGILSFMLYGLAFIGGWTEQIGSFSANETATDIGILISLIVPSEAMWRMASYLLQPPALRSLSLSPFSIASAPSLAMLLYTIIYIAGLLIWAIRTFAQRDL
ncbi:MAG: ABC transporter permease subunit [Anaerolineae bacterium]|nr:ABC transporter permease subunit [Anaerolineae bacterium]